MADDSNKVSSGEDVPADGNLATAGGERDRQPHFRLFRRPHSFRGRVFRQAIEIFVAAICIVPLAFLIWTLFGVRLPFSKSVTAHPAITMNAADGQPIFGQSAFRLPPVAAKDMPADVIDAVLSIEDRGFYQHGAIDLPSIARAFIDNLRAGKIVAGGSTITQQLVKMRFVGPQRTYKRKLDEAVIAYWLQFHLTKDQILTSYLNNVYLGSGAIGFPAAARLYFNKNLADLSIPEAAMLAGMVNAPSQDDPLTDLKAARDRAATVLDAMVANGKVSAADALAAKLHPATPDPAEISPPSTGWFADWVHERAAKAARDVDGPVHVRTTLDMRLQNLATAIVKSTLAKYGRQKRATQAALVAMQPDGAVVAMVGGRSYRDSKFNRAVRAERQPGSAFKLFDYYAALRQGFTPDDGILDGPVDIKGWRPQNYGHRYHGRVTLADAFAHSLNDATVRLTQEIGIGNVIAAARDLGLRAPLNNDPSLALGTSNVTLLDLTSAYAAVRAGVTPVEPWGIASVQVPGRKLSVPVGQPDEPQHSLGQYQAELTELLRGVVEHGTGRAAALPGLAAGKTGTTQDYRDAWFVGFDNSLVVGVWVGNDDHSPMRGVVGGSLPAMIWKQFMEQAPPPAATVAAQQETNPSTPPASGSNAAAGPQTTASLQPRASKRLFDQNSLSANENNPAAPIGPGGAKCDIPACEEHYHSFRASDCTYQPYDGGPRQYCTRQAGDRNGSSNRTEKRLSALPPHRDEAPFDSRRPEGPYDAGPGRYGPAGPPGYGPGPGPWFGMQGNGW
ncbi:MAG: PBP1A family penicillin-binding protein [Xanthobacteraceae bacterium]